MTQKLEVELLKPAASRRKLLRNCFERKVFARCEIVKFSTVVPFSDVFDSVQNVLPAELNKALIRESVSKRVSAVLVMAKLSRVGSIAVSDSIVVQDGVLQEYSKIPAMDAWPFLRAVDLAAEIKWPKLQTISFKKVWSWANQN